MGVAKPSKFNALYNTAKGRAKQCRDRSMNTETYVCNRSAVLTYLELEALEGRERCDFLLRALGLG